MKALLEHHKKYVTTPKEYDKFEKTQTGQLKFEEYFTQTFAI